jgi:glycosyltransferase involved in cell wall biosynthesis
MTGQPSVTVFVFVHDGSADYRLRYPAEALAKDGYDVEIVDLSDVEDEVEVRQTDVVVVSRPVRKSQADLVEQLAAMDVRVVVDVDDDIEHLVPEHSLVRLRHPAPAPRAGRLPPSGRHHGRPCARPTSQYDPVIAQNLAADFLADVKPGPMDKRAPVLGWFGGLGSHPNDLQQTGHGVWAAMLAGPADLGFVGAVEYADGSDNLAEYKTRLRVPPTHPIHWRGYTSDPAELWPAVACFDVGLVPLQPCRFNAAKSNLKGIEYAACGVPFVASPTPEYRALAEQGVGLLAETPVQWKRQILALLRDQELRDDQVLNGRIYCRLNNYATRAEEYWCAWTE